MTETTPDRTVNDVLRDMLIIHSGRTRYHGQKPRDDELLVAEIERLRTEERVLRAALQDVVDDMTFNIAPSKATMAKIKEALQ